MPAITNQQGHSDTFPFELVRPHLELVEVAIREQVRAFDPMVEPYVSYVCNTSGKRIRPALAVLTGGALGEAGENHRKIGVILELIHMATLVHDDIIDGATTRRIGCPHCAAAAAWSTRSAAAATARPPPLITCALLCAQCCASWWPHCGG